MSEFTLERILGFNAELIRISATGLPMELGFGGTLMSLENSLKQINAQLALDVGRGLSVEKAIETAAYLPRQYRSALETWIHSGESSEAFEGASTSAMAERELRGNVRVAFIQPLIAFCLVYVAFIYLCTVTALRLESLYAQQFQDPSPSLQFLKLAREWAGIWGLLVPLIFVAVVVSLLSSWRKGMYRWLPGSAKYTRSVEKAIYADRMASLIERGNTVAQSLAIAGPIFSDAEQAKSPQAATKPAVESVRSGQPEASSGTTTQSLPSMLRLALAGDLSGESAPSFLRFASGVYRQTARLRAASWHDWLPAILAALIGGAFVLGYCLSLFLPFVELLNDVATQRGAI